MYIHAVYEEPASSKMSALLPDGSFYVTVHQLFASTRVCYVFCHTSSHSNATHKYRSTLRCATSMSSDCPLGGVPRLLPFRLSESIHVIRLVPSCIYHLSRLQPSFTALAACSYLDDVAAQAPHALCIGNVTSCDILSRAKPQDVFLYDHHIQRASVLGH